MQKLRRNKKINNRYIKFLFKRISRVRNQPRFRYKSPQYVANEIEELINNYGIDRLSFTDEDFFGDKAGVERALELFRILIDRGIKIDLHANARARTVMWLARNNYLDLCSQGGVKYMYVGLESYNDKSLKLFDKGITTKDIDFVVDELSKHKIRINPGLITFDPTLTLDNVKGNIELYKKIDYYDAFIFTRRLVLYPNASEKIQELFKNDTYFQHEDVGKLFLNGGGCGKQTILTYKEINKIIDHSKPVLYLPLAMDESEHSYDSCYEWIQEEISVIDIPSVDMVRTFEELAEKDLSKYSLIFIGGGNTYKLLNGIKTTKTYDKLKEYIANDGIVYGSSAGAVIFGKDISIIEVMDKNEIKIKDTSGFNLLNDIYVFVHYTNYRSKLTKEENEHLTEKYTDFIEKYAKKNKKVIAIPEEDSIFFDGKNIKIIGGLAYYIFENGKKEKYTE